MAFVSITPTTMGTAAGARSFYDLKEGLKSLGWTVASSGDGLGLYSAVGDIITVRGNGAGGVNNRAWVLLIPHTPSITYAGITVQITDGAVDDSVAVIDFRTKFSATAGFTGGAPDFETTPSATDELVLGGGSDAAPTGLTAWNGLSSNALGLAGEHLVLISGDTEAPSRFVAAWVQDFSPFLSRGGLVVDHLQLSQIPYPIPNISPYTIWQPGATATSGGAFAVQSMRVGTNVQDARANFDPAGPVSYRGIELEQLMLGAGTDISVPGTNVFLPTAHDLVPIFCSRNLGSPDPDGGVGVMSILRVVAQAPALAGDQNQLYTIEDADRAWLRINTCAMPWDGRNVSASWNDEIPAVLWNQTVDPVFIGGRGVDGFRMRGFDGTLNDYVYWSAQQPDPGGARYSGPGPLSDVVVTHKVRPT